MVKAKKPACTAEVRARRKYEIKCPLGPRCVAPGPFLFYIIELLSEIIWKDTRKDIRIAYRIKPGISKIGSATYLNWPYFLYLEDLCPAGFCITEKR